MSRRDSRVHVASARQNDALLEFETFKKKFLLANKHITKLNSTLSVRIEELNAQISTLYVENLRLRASEIALASQLKREREKSQRIMGDTEAATLSLLKHLGTIRKSHNVTQMSTPSPPSQPSAQPAQTRRPPQRLSPTMRLAQPPTIPGISEDPEPASSSCDEMELPQIVTNTRIKVTSISSGGHANTKPRLSSSRLPLPLRVSTPPLADLPEETAGRRRKPARRQSGLLSADTVAVQPHRPPSPAFGSPIRLEAALAEEEEEIAVINGEIIDIEVNETEESEEVAKKARKEKKARARERESEKAERDIVLPPERAERKKIKDKSEVAKTKLQDVTNAPRGHVEVPVTGCDNDAEQDSSLLTPIPSSPSLGSTTPEPAYLPTPLPSSAASTPARPSLSLPPMQTDAEAGRERRARKSVNYAEPKLNTKMRKPDVILPINARPSITGGVALTPAVTPNPTPAPTPIMNGSADRNGSTSRRRSLDEPSSSSSSAESAAGIPPRPKSQPHYDSPTRGTSSSSRSSSSMSSSTSAVAAAAKRKKMRRSPVLDEDDYDDDGAEADAEFSDFKSTWVNLDGRRRSTHQSNTMRRAMGEMDDSRRHSLAV
ncbi:hypothetical protein BD410DRAFT_822282 [Rickenella mellea]|uniref:Shugoshin C-terminal domain-containing protein n=1 Tax=Rickenella mellea TaxID=50990 RepID=A0A4Y7PV57_9AGAM|nr:hypothetical protein BD410DRAFT_822282 [Rickenella mellea]